MMQMPCIVRHRQWRAWYISVVVKGCYTKLDVSRNKAYLLQGHFLENIYQASIINQRSVDSVVQNLDSNDQGVIVWKLHMEDILFYKSNGL